MMLHPPVWIIIPTFNALAVTRTCLADLSRQSYSNIRVVLSDSGSTDGSREVIPNEFPSVAIVKGDPDWWWTKATNEGVKYALTHGSADDYIMTLNNDVLVPRDYVAAMVSLAKLHPGSVIGSLIYDAADKTRVVECGSYINWPTMKYYFISPADFDDSGFSKKLTFLCGKGVLYPVGVFREHGLFDEAALPHYGADQDFVASCKKKGYAIRVQTAVPLYSREEITAIGAGDVKKVTGKLKLLFIRKSKLNLAVHMRLMLRHCPKGYWATSLLFLMCRLIGHIFIKNGVQRGAVLQTYCHRHRETQL